MTENWYKEQLRQSHDNDLYRRMLTAHSAPGPKMVIEGEEKKVFCSNNYLGLANHPEIISAIHGALSQWGFGSGGSRLICGNTEAHNKLQNRLAHSLKKEASLLFPSGFSANNSILSTLPQKGDLIAIDKLVHASIIDGSRASRAQVRTWPHRNTSRLKRLLERGGYRQVFIVTDSLFSMDGDLAFLEELLELKRKFNTILIIDEAHAFGCIGPNGKGLAEQKGCLEDIDIFVGTLSKALGGAGGFLACSRTIADYLVNNARGFIYTTGLPAINCVAAQVALDIMENEPERRKRLQSHAALLRKRCRELQLDIGTSQSHIIPVILGSPERATNVSRQLWDKGFWVPAIRPPTVPPGGSRLRISLMSEHERDDIEILSEILQDIL